MDADSPIGKASSEMAKLGNLTDPAMFITNRAGEMIEDTLGYYGPSKALRRHEDGKTGPLEAASELMAGGPPPPPPDPLAPQAQVGDEGVRRGAMERNRTKEEQRLYLTRGQPRGLTPLGGTAQTLG